MGILRYALFDDFEESFDPFGLSSICYLNAKFGSSITIATGVSQWASLTGSVNFTESTAGQQPAYNLTGLDGSPAVVFDGSNDRLLDVSGESIGHFTLIFLVKTSGSGFLFAHGGSYLQTGSGSTFEVGRPGVATSGKNIASGWLNNNKAKIVIWRFKGTHATNEVFVNGVLKSTTDQVMGNPGDSSVSAVPGLMTRSSTGSGYLAGALSYFKAFDFALSQEQIDNEVRFILREFLPTAVVGAGSLPILDANLDLTY